MRFPLEPMGIYSVFTGFVVAYLLGIGFGFFLERGGFSSARKLTAQFYLKDFSVLKVMFTAIVVAGTGFWWLVNLGMLDLSYTYINPTFLYPQIVGGLILGVGFVVGGYCPGTSCVALATGKLDALWYIAGIFAGIFLYSVIEPAIHNFYNSGSMGEAYLWKWLGTSPGVIMLIAVIIAIAAFTVGTRVEKKSGGVVQPEDAE